jgi:hypothetical protein
MIKSIIRDIIRGAWIVGQTIVVIGGFFGLLVGVTQAVVSYGWWAGAPMLAVFLLGLCWIVGSGDK